MKLTFSFLLGHNRSSQEDWSIENDAGQREDGPDRQYQNSVTQETEGLPAGFACTGYLSRMSGGV